MNGKYTKVKKTTPTDEKINANEIRITSTGKTRSYISYATNILQENKDDKVIIKAMGKAINKAITIAEIVKHRVEGLHQITELDSNEITEEFEPTEEGLSKIEKKRTVSSISITLSLKTLDTKNIGYQKPIPKEEVKKEIQIDEEEEDQQEEKKVKKEKKPKPVKKEKVEGEEKKEKPEKKEKKEKPEKKEKTEKKEKPEKKEKVEGEKTEKPKKEKKPKPTPTTEGGAAPSTTTTERGESATRGTSTRGKRGAKRGGAKRGESKTEEEVKKE
jgi:DNA-binding protein Alba